MLKFTIWNSLILCNGFIWDKIKTTTPEGYVGVTGIVYDWDFMNDERK